MRAVITGANRGIGLEFCKQLKSKKYKVIALCRKASEELKKLNVQIIEDVDVRDVNKLEKVKNKINQPIDLLINNAGIYIRDNLQSLEFENLQKHFEINSIGPIKVALSLLPLMQKNTKIIMISSQVGSIANTKEAKSYGYKASKAALNMFSKILSIDLKALGIVVGIFHPGYVKTDMTDHSGDLEPKTSVQNMLSLIEKLELQDSGTFFHENGKIIPW